MLLLQLAFWYVLFCSTPGGFATMSGRCCDCSVLNSFFSLYEKLQPVVSVLCWFRRRPHIVFAYAKYNKVRRHADLSVLDNKTALTWAVLFLPAWSLSRLWYAAPYSRRSAGSCPGTCPALSGTWYRGNYRPAPG